MFVGSIRKSVCSFSHRVLCWKRVCSGGHLGSRMSVLLKKCQLMRDIPMAIHVQFGFIHVLSSFEVGLNAFIYFLIGSYMLRTAVMVIFIIRPAPKILIWCMSCLWKWFLRSRLFMWIGNLSRAKWMKAFS